MKANRARLPPQSPPAIFLFSTIWEPGTGYRHPGWNVVGKPAQFAWQTDMRRKLAFEQKLPGASRPAWRRLGFGIRIRPGLAGVLTCIAPRGWRGEFQSTHRTQEWGGNLAWGYTFYKGFSIPRVTSWNYLTGEEYTQRRRSLVPADVSPPLPPSWREAPGGDGRGGGGGGVRDAPQWGRCTFCRLMLLDEEVTGAACRSFGLLKSFGFFLHTFFDFHDCNGSTSVL